MYSYPIGPALTAHWSEALPLTARSLTTAWVPIPAGACEKVASDLGLGAVGSASSLASLSFSITVYGFNLEC